MTNIIIGLEAGYCSECDIEMEKVESATTNIKDYLTNESKFVRYEKFICHECGTRLTKRYEENFEIYD